MPLFGPPNIEKLEDSRDVAGLIKALGYKKDARVRYLAARALGEVGGEAADSALIAALKDDDFNLRKASIQALGDSRSPQAVEVLITLLDSCEWDAVLSAAEALGNIKDKRAVELLIARLYSLDRKDSSARLQLVKALKEVGWTPGSDPTSARYWIALENWEKCREIGVPAMEPLINVLRHPIEDIRRQAIHVLAGISDPRTAEVLIPLLKDSSIFVRIDAIFVLGKLGGRSAVEALLPRLHDESIEIRRTAAEALGKLGDLRALDALTTLLEDKDDQVCAAAARAIGGLKAVNAMEKLVAMLKDKSAPIRQAAVDGLGLIGDPRAVNALTGMLYDEDDSVCKDAAHALEKMGISTAEFLIRVLQNDEYEVRNKAGKTLVMLYQYGVLTEQDKKMILINREVIKARLHTDQSVPFNHTDHGSPGTPGTSHEGCHQDYNSEHEDFSTGNIF
jgi:HEAT repeat protein